MSEKAYGLFVTANGDASLSASVQQALGMIAEEAGVDIPRALELRKAKAAALCKTLDSAASDVLRGLLRFDTRS